MTSDNDEAIPKLTVLIAAHGRPDLIARTLDSLERCRKPEGYCGVVVVENGNPAGIEDVVQRHGDARYTYFEVGNKSLALNHALQMVDDGLVVFSDDDVVFSDDLLMIYDEAARRFGRTRFFGGPYRCDYESPPPSWLMSHLPRSAVGWSIEPAREHEIDRGEWFIGFNWAANRQLILDAGGFSEHFGPGSPSGARGQEKNMQARLRAQGIPGVYLPEALVWHFVPTERCTPEWTLSRAHQNGLSVGLRLAAQGAFRKATARVQYEIACILTTLGERVTSMVGLTGLAFTFRRVGRTYRGTLSALKQ